MGFSMNTERFTKVALGTAALVAGATSAYAQDASGAFFGLHGASANGEVDELLGTYDVSGSSFGAFGGYNFVNGDWTYGVELAYTSGFDIVDSPYSPSSVERIVDLRAKFGKSFGNTLVYGALGYTDAKITYFDGFAHEGASGMNVGIGFETTFQGKYFVGADVTSRRLTVDNTFGYADDVNLTTGSLRVGMRF